jgi:hypothetical protein
VAELVVDDDDDEVAAPAMETARSVDAGAPSAVLASLLGCCCCCCCLEPSEAYYWIGATTPFGCVCVRVCVCASLYGCGIECSMSYPEKFNRTRMMLLSMLSSSMLLDRL